MPNTPTRHFVLWAYISSLRLRHIFCNDNRNSSSRAIFNHNITDVNRCRYNCLADFFHTVENLSLRDISCCFYRCFCNRSSRNLHRRSHNSGRIRHFLLCICLSTRACIPVTVISFSPIDTVREHPNGQPIQVNSLTSIMTPPLCES